MDIEKFYMHSKTLTVSSLMRKLAKGTMRLGLNSLGDYTWGEEEARSFIESILSRIPLPCIYLWENENEVEIITDGWKRIQSIISFVENKSCIRDGLYYKDMPDTMKERIQDANFTCHSLSSGVGWGIAKEVYGRLHPSATNIMSESRIIATVGIAGGKPRITGHCITVENIVIWHERMGLSVDDISSYYPDLPVKDINAALEYFAANREKINRAIVATADYAGTYLKDGKTAPILSLIHI